MSKVYNFRSGLGNTAAFQVSGIPFVTGPVDASTLTRVKFPSVTSWVTVGNYGEEFLLFGFSSEGTDNDRAFGLMSGSSSPVYDLKVTEIWLSGSDVVTVMAGLTSIENGAIDNVTLSPSGSNWSGSAAAQV